MGIGVQDIGLGGSGGHRFLLVELVQDEVQAEGTRFHAVAVHLEPLLAIGRRSGQQRPDLGQGISRSRMRAISSAVAAWSRRYER